MPLTARLFIKNQSMAGTSNLIRHDDPDYTYTKVGMSFNFGKSHSKGQVEPRSGLLQVETLVHFEDTTDCKTNNRTSINEGSKR